MRIVLIHWKKTNEAEVFSNLKNFCLSYPQYNYNTLNNYLGKEKKAYENDAVRVERKSVIARPKLVNAERDTLRKIVPVARKGLMKKADDDMHNLQYWLAQPAQKRAAATTFLVSQMLGKGQRLDKSMVNKIKPV